MQRAERKFGALAPTTRRTDRSGIRITLGLALSAQREGRRRVIGQKQREDLFRKKESILKKARKNKIIVCTRKQSYHKYSFSVPFLNQHSFFITIQDFPAPHRTFQLPFQPLC